MRALIGQMGFLVVGGSLALAQPAPATREYPGMCDASAALAVSANLFIVANDEDNILRVYRREKPEAPQSIDLEPLLKLNDSAEIDIEGVAQIGEIVYWIGSHGQNKNGENRPNRRLLFATRVTVKDKAVRLEVVGTPYTALRDDLIEAPSLQKYGLAQAAKLSPKAKNGFNIEGLASTPEGRLLIGFRNPLPGGKGLVVTLDNPSEVMAAKPSKLGAVYELNLGGLGIRSMEYSPGRASYLIVAGSFDDAGKFAFYTWSGKTGDDAIAISGVNFASLRPEAMFIYPFDSKFVQFLSDDENDDCRRRPASMQRFRSFNLELP